MILQSTLININFNDYLQINQIENNLFNSTLQYFFNVLNQTKSIINNNNKEDDDDDANFIDFQNVITAKELTVSSTILFTMLAINPNKLLPLISFDQSQSDFLSISKGIVLIITKSSPIIFGSDLIGIIYYGTLNGINPPNLNNPISPIIKNLIDELNKNYHHHQCYQCYHQCYHHQCYQYKAKYEIFYETLDILNKGIYATQFFEFPVPFFRWINLISDDFRKLLYEKDKYSIKLLYIFSILCLYSGFYLNDEMNIWKDFIDWYINNQQQQQEEEAQEAQQGGQFEFSMDKKLYQLIILEKKRCDKFKDFAKFDL